MVDVAGTLRVARGAAVTMASLALLLVGVEIGLRLAWGPPVDPAEDRRDPSGLRFDRDPELGWVFPAHAHGTFERGGISCDVRTNRWGIRSPEVIAEKPGAIRILVLGDSYAFGWCIAEEAAFPRQLEAMLREKYPAADIEVINAAIPGYGVYQQRRILERIAGDVQVDVVISTFSLASDMVDELRIRRYGPRGLLDYSPAILDPRSRLAELIRHSRLLRRFSDTTAPLQFHLANIRPKGVRLMSESVKDVVRRCQREDTKVLLVAFPRRSQVAAGGVLAQAGRVTTWQARRRYREVAEECGVPLLDATRVLCEAGAEGPVFLRGDTHWNVRGHRVVAEAIAQALPADWLRPGRQDRWREVSHVGSPGHP